MLPIAGGRLLSGAPAFPGALTTAQHWANYNGCAATPQTDPEAFDLDAAITGTETTRQHFAGCPPGIAVELWTIAGAKHFPDFSSGAFAARTWAWLNSHPKPDPS